MNKNTKYFQIKFFIFIVILLNFYSFDLFTKDLKIDTIMLIDSNKTNKRELDKKELKSNTTNKVDEDIIPSSEKQNLKFTAEQDSAYFRAMRANVTSNIRIWNDLNLTKYIWFDYLKNIKKSDVAIAMESLSSLPKEYFMPDPKEVVQRQINISNAFYVPFVPTYDPNNALFTFAEIGNFLGLTEDVSPLIKYNLERQSNVEIVIYSIRAYVIAKVFDGVQPAGSYSISWNGRDESGKKMPPGDYIAEIRIANDKYFRKRIIIQ